MALRSAINQLFPPKPAFTEKDMPSQEGRVFVVTGGNSGIGYELCSMLYGIGATIYMASRSKERAEAAIATIVDTAKIHRARGSLRFLQLDLNDLDSVKAAAASFADQETKLDVLWNNAGTGAFKVKAWAKTAQGFEPMIGMHCIATLLFTELVRPQLRVAAAAARPPSGRVRVVWTSSIGAEDRVPQHGIDFSLLDSGALDPFRNYGVSKVGSWMLSREMARRYAADGIVSVAQNPGNIKANSWEGAPAILMFFMNPIMKEPKFGGYTGLYAGLSPDVGSGAYIIPWGRVRPDEESPRQDIVKAMVSETEGGLGLDTKFWNWCEEKWKPFM